MKSREETLVDATVAVLDKQERCRAQAFFTLLYNEDPSITITLMNTINCLQAILTPSQTKEVVDLVLKIILGTVEAMREQRVGNLR